MILRIWRKLIILFCTTSDQKIGRYIISNMCRVPSLDYLWLTRFIEYYYPDNGRSVHIYSVYGKKRNQYFNPREVSIFFTGENVCEFKCGWIRKVIRFIDYFEYLDRIKDYKDCFVNDVDISLGFENRKEPNYIRFPNWIGRYFDPKDDKDMIRERIRRINDNAHIPANGAITIVSAHDMWGTRKKVYDGCKECAPILSASTWRNNTNVLKEVYGDNKIEFLSDYKFNICCENVDVKDYVTEKIFDAFSAGTIPIYFGSNNEPEPGIINPKAVIFWDSHGDNMKNKKEISRLLEDDAYYREFIKQPRLFEDAAVEYVHERFVLLKNKLNALINA